MQHVLIGIDRDGTLIHDTGTFPGSTWPNETFTLLPRADCKRLFRRRTTDFSTHSTPTNTHAQHLNSCRQSNSHRCQTKKRLKNTKSFSDEKKQTAKNTDSQELFS